MPEKQLYQLYDRKAQLTAGPIMAAHRAAPIVRAFHELLGDKTSEPGKYPEDFDILHIGSQDEETGKITPIEKPEAIAMGSQWAAAVNRDNQNG